MEIKKSYRKSKPNQTKYIKSEFLKDKNRDNQRKDDNLERKSRDSQRKEDNLEGKNRGNQRKEDNIERKVYRKNSRVDNNTKDSESRKKEGNLRKSSAYECKYARKCGGCRYQGVPYKEQLKIKQKTVNEVLGEFGKVYPITGMDNPYHYRNKVHAVFDRDRKGNIISGVYEEGTHDVVAIDRCLIEDEKADAIINDIRGMLKSFKIKTYDEDTGYGLFRHVLIRRGFKSNEIMVVLVLGSPILPSKNNFVKAIRKLHPEITTVIVNVNDKKTSMVLGNKENVIYGKGFIKDTLCGYTFKISPKSFYQVNPVQTEKLYNKAIELADLTTNETVIDAYCGIGTLGIIASKHAKNVISVELNRDAFKDAITNAKLNDVKNIVFYNEDAGEFMVKMAENNQSADIVIMDPPRAGSDEPFLQSLVKLSPEKVIYISCNPETLARDLRYLVKKGYRMKGAWPFDMFPLTNHVECVCLMTRNK